MMKFSLPHAAATALALVMAAGGAGAASRPPVPTAPTRPDLPVLLAQADGSDAEQPSGKAEEPLRKRVQERREERRKNREAEAGKAAQEEARPRRKAEEQEQEKQPAKGAEKNRAQREKKRETQAESSPEQKPAQAAEPERKPKKETPQQAKPKTPDKPASTEAEAPKGGSPKSDDTAKKREDEKKRRAEGKKEQAAPDAEAGKQAGAPKPGEKQQADAPKKGTDQATEGAGSTDPEATTREERRKRREQAQEGRPAEGQPAQAEQGEAKDPSRREKRREAKGPDDGASAPVLDSQKQEQRQPRDQNREAGRKGGQDRQDDQARQDGDRKPRKQEERRAGPPPKNDRDAQASVRPERIRPVTAEEGRRRDRPDDPRRWQRPQGSKVVREVDDRVIVEVDNRVFVESNDRHRLTRGARDVYYEDLPNGRIRETVVRRDGSRVVTVRNRYGDIVRRSRVMPDNREVVLVYVDERDYDHMRDWRDPGYYLPPMRLDIPVEEYILDAGVTNDVDAYYQFLDQPPVETVERLYSVDEVKRSARIRDKTRRIDLDTLTFEFGSASIPEDQIARLEAVADAMARILKDNPAETFLIEGHTDAVGSELANLALSDRRAEAVASALTDFFEIPPENLATQGYGEEFLKVNTQAPERENRRVAIRRITPLVAPVASAE